MGFPAVMIFFGFLNIYKFALSKPVSVNSTRRILFHVKGTARWDYVIEKSKFIGIAKSVDDFEEAMKFVQDHGDSKASHNCWAYHSGTISRANDDGEPGGTAGRPILKAIEELNFTDTIVLVTRYFGGIKLGTGGLMRAYGLVAENVLEIATKLTKVSTSSIKITAGVEYTGVLYQVLQFYETSRPFGSSMIRIDEGYLSDVAKPNNSLIVLTLSIASEDLEWIKHQIKESTRGQAQIELL